MGFLIDKELRLQVRATPPKLLTGLEPGDVDKAIRGCSIDLHVGAVFLPGSKSGEVGSADKPFLRGVHLKEGESAVVRTVESFQLDDKHGAFVLPVSSVSIGGLLVTNPGHVDPGYVGPVHVTVINMGKDPISLAPGGRLLRALIYRLDAPVEVPKGSPASPINDELLQKLSRDFLSVNARTAKAAKSEIDAAVKQGQWLQFVMPAFFTLLGIVVTSFVTWSTSTARYEDRIKSLEEAKAVDRLKVLELNYPTQQQLLELRAEVELLREAAAKTKRP